jgi:hypothetical protein
MAPTVDMTSAPMEIASPEVLNAGVSPVTNPQVGNPSSGNSNSVNQSGDMMSPTNGSGVSPMSLGGSVYSESVSNSHIGNSPMVNVNFGAGPLASFGDVNEATINGNLASLSSEFQAQVQAFTAARQNNDEAGADEALRKMERIKRQVKALKECSSVFESAAGQPEASTRSAGLTLSHRDLPKFQLSSCVRLPFPNEEAFESVEHFLTRFENIIKGSAYRDVELVWRKFLPLCLPYTDHVWFENELSKCRNWSEARSMFKDHHGSNLATRHYTDMVFTMQMGAKESISEYSKRFLQAVYNAGLPSNDPRIADRFLASLTLPVQTIIRVTVARVGRNKNANGENWTVEYITQVGRDILGDDASAYAVATSLIPNANDNSRMVNRSSVMSNGESKTFRKKPKFSHKVVKSYFCKHHGKNGTHDTGDCFSLKNQDKPAGKSCYTCKKPWVPGHKCASSNTKKVLAVSKNDQASGKREENEGKLIDEATSEINSMMEGLTYDCKYTNTEKEKEVNDMFNLLTPIIIENQKLMGRIDTGRDISFINANIF